MLLHAEASSDLEKNLSTHIIEILVFRQKTRINCLKEVGSIGGDLSQADEQSNGCVRLNKFTSIPSQMSIRLS